MLVCKPSLLHYLVVIKTKRQKHLFFNPTDQIYNCPKAFISTRFLVEF